MIARKIYNHLSNNLYKGKAIVLFGPRQVGKTTLLQQVVAAQREVKSIWLSGDDLGHRDTLSDITISDAKRLFKGLQLIVIDEAQRVRNIGMTIKVLVDYLPEVQVLASGSSSFSLANKINEPLTGRKVDYWLFPLSFAELSQHTSVFSERNELANRLVFGSYPAVINNAGDEQEVLRTLSNEYLFKDIFEIQDLRKPELLVGLLKALALQVGSQVSFAELAGLLKVSSVTIERYITLLEQAFIIFRLPAFSRNLRTEIAKSRKIYFYDCGLRNALIGNFAKINDRGDVGALWENFLVAERKKSIEYSRRWTNSYFWRNTNQQEIDYVEERDGQIAACEFAYSAKQSKKIPVSFTAAYNPISSSVITNKNYDEWLCEPLEG